MHTLLDLLPDMERLGGREAVLYDDGIRTRRWSYHELRRHIAGLARELDRRGLARGDRLLLWGENRPEWIAGFWASLTRGITVVPLDFRSSPDFVARVQKAVEAKLLLHGASVDPSSLPVPPLPFERIAALDAGRDLAAIDAHPDEIVQILYTSGTTGDPKGVVQRHRHLVSNLEPIRKEISKYALLARPFQPIRVLDLLPTSHVFGGFTGLYLPVVLGGAVAFMKEIHPGAILETVRRHRISILVAVPRFLSNLRREIERRFDLPQDVPASGGGLGGGLHRYWRHRDVHREFGWKFWAVLSGGARLPRDDEDFWWRLGFVLVQGYGLTETSSLISTNHPFHPKRGSLGKVVGDQEIRLAPDGEILVRGKNVSAEYFGQAPAVDREDRWLATGDIGEIGEDGTLFYKGRKKDVIVGPEGMNVYPSDVEAVLARAAEVREAVVVGRATEQGDVVHAVLLLRDPSANAEAVVAGANRTLEPHQRIREWSVWPDEDFPRTSSTFKVRRHDVAKAVAERDEPLTEAARPSSSARALLARQLGRDADELGAGQDLSEDLGLTSLDRIELLTSLEERYGCRLSESQMAEVATVEDLDELVERSSSPEPGEESLPTTPFSGLVRFARSTPLRWLRAAFREAVILPLLRYFIPLRVTGSFLELTPPVIFAPNHTSNLDTLALLAALPRHFRGRLAPAISYDYFRPTFERTGSIGTRLSLRLQYWLAVVTLNVFPLPESLTGAREALRFAGRLVDRGYSILIFPEGRRSPDGAMHAFRPGVGLMAVRLGIPVVPIRIDGLYEVMSVHDNWPKPGPVSLRIGPPLRFHETEDFREVTARIREAVERLATLNP